MKSFAATLAIALALGTTTFTTNTYAADLDALQGICESVAADDKTRVRKKLNDSGLKLRDVYDAISCSGTNLVRYAINNNANDVGTFLVKRLPSSHFDTSGDAEWAAGNGFGDSPIVATIAAR